ncbi:MAG: dihydroxyacetone kinase phosphoryl donor subunit DhaM [Bacillota bacterium]|nr:dihydroxyacetone kinase phosphoryl donor subunit DhaM [Bacillota bacterium]
MVGLVLVSHSRRLAEGLEELLRPLAGDVPLVPAGGTSDGRLGSDATRVAEACRQADRGDGVLVLGDIGSSILSSKLALELLAASDPAIRVRIADAPLVEGAVAAAVQASLGDPLEAVVRAAEEAGRQAKL